MIDNVKLNNTLDTKGNEMIDKNILINYGDRPAVITDGGRLFRYGDLVEVADRIAVHTHNRSLIFCLTSNTIGSLAGYISFILNGVVPVMIDNEWDNDYLKNFIEIFRPEYMWLPSNRQVDISGSVVLTSLYDYSLIKLERASVYPLHKNLALLLPTSGSTGSPKLVKLTYENIYDNAVSISKYLSIDKKERPITALPMHYSFGLSIINSHLINGATILLTDKSLIEKEFWSFLKAEKATSLSGIPYSFEILKKLRFFNMDIPDLKTITQAGGKLNDELNREFSEYCLKTGKRFFVMYGQTEATARMSYLPPDFSLKKLGSMGISIPGGEFSLIDENGINIKGPNIEGELVYKGKNVSMGYAICGEDLAKGDENEGVLITGDMAKRDQDGFYYIVGRKKRFIKLYGNRVNLDETERLLKNIFPDCACSGEDDKMKIYVTDPRLVDDVRSFVSQKTGINPRAFDVIYNDKIPKNSSGKTIYSKLPN